MLVGGSDNGSDNGSGKVDDAQLHWERAACGEGEGESESEERKQQSKIIALDNAPHAGCLYAFFLHDNRSQSGNNNRFQGGFGVLLLVEGQRTHQCLIILHLLSSRLRNAGITSIPIPPGAPLQVE